MHHESVSGIAHTKFRRFRAERLDDAAITSLKELARACRGDILKMTTLAASGHPGGSMSSLEIYLTLYSFANIFPEEPYRFDRDRIVVSHGHTSPGVYASLGRLGFFDVDDAVAHFRQAGSAYEGHVERSVPGVEWGTGNLGQGLSAACGFALASRIRNKDFHVFTVMGDGEQQKGQIGEARRFAKKHNLNNMTVFVDCNGLQISGATEEVMYQDISANFASDGWEVMEIDGHDFQAIYQALHHSVNRLNTPVAIMARTVMGKGVSLMEHKEEFHGRALTNDEIAVALAELGLENDIARYQEKRRTGALPQGVHPPVEKVVINGGTPKTYGKDDKTDNRSAFGTALKDMAHLNCGLESSTPVAVLDCDLATSVKTMGFQIVSPDNFFQGGIQEHNAATVAGALSASGVLTFFADFGVFGVDETYNQHRLNDINGANLKLICTHIGLDVGEDGKTHQCVDYLGLLSNTFGYKVVVPADPNQTDRAVRYAASAPGNFFVGMGRSKISTILDESGNPFFAGDYVFEYGKADLLRQGDQAAILTMGAMVPYALKAWDALKAEGISVKLYNVSCPLDIDLTALKDAASTGLIVTYEDHNTRTGLGSMVANALAEHGIAARLKKLGVTTYSGSGNPDLLYKSMGMGVDDLVRSCRK